MGNEYTILRTVNNFRNQNGRDSVNSWDYTVEGHCLQHSLAMSRDRNVYHAIPEYLEGWSECVAMSMVDTGNIDDILGDMIFNVLGKSEEHRNILLNANIVAGAIILNNWVAYLTLRCK